MSNRVAGAAPKPSPVVKQCNHSLKQMFGHKDSTGEVTNMYLIQKHDFTHIFTFTAVPEPLHGGAAFANFIFDLAKQMKPDAAFGGQMIYLTPSCL